MSLSDNRGAPANRFHRTRNKNAMLPMEKFGFNDRI
jgi:hypothetical protein